MYKELRNFSRRQNNQIMEIVEMKNIISDVFTAD